MTDCLADAKLITKSGDVICRSNLCLSILKNNHAGSCFLVIFSALSNVDKWQHIKELVSFANLNCDKPRKQAKQIGL